MSQESGNGFSEYKNLILEKLGELHGIKDEIVKLRIELAVQKVKAGFYGSVSGAITGLLAVLAYILFK